MPLARNLMKPPVILGIIQPAMFDETRGYPCATRGAGRFASKTGAIDGVLQNIPAPWVASGLVTSVAMDRAW